MITFILKICIACYLIYMIHQVHTMLQYNSNATVKTIQLPHKDKITEELKTKNPLLIIYPENNLDLSVSNMNLRIPGYIIKDGKKLISLEQLLQSEVIQITDNQKIIDDYQLNTHCDKVVDLIKDTMTCDITYKLSLYKGNYQSKLYKNYRENLLFQSLNDSYTLYLFNPKHEQEIKGLELNSIKKWGIKLDVAKDTIVVIPTEWSYFYEQTNDKELLLCKIECDSISTWIFNRLRRK